MVRSRFRFRTTAVLTVCALGCASAASAQVVFDNGAPYSGQSSGGLNVTSTAVADDFQMSSEFSFDSVRFFVTDNAPGLADNFSGTLSWYVYRDNGAARPGEVALSGFTSAVTITDTGARLSGIPENQVAQYDFSTGVQTLAAGTYWLRITEVPASASADTSNLFWITTTPTMTAQQGHAAVSSGNITNPKPGEYGPTGAQLAFQLRNTVLQAPSANAPEPTGLALLGAVVPTAALLWRRPRLRK